MVDIVVATKNRGKLREISRLLEETDYRVLGLDLFPDAPDVVEDGDTFTANARKKAEAIARHTKKLTLADDSGLVVDALDGEPGVFSARYAGENATDEQRYTKLLNEMKGKTNRQAAFECVISIAVPSGPALTYEARCEGLIAQAPSGENGFGYDPVFYYPPLNKTFGQLSREEKSRVSHRGKALQELREEFEKVLIWIGQNMPVQESIGCQHGKC